MERKAVDSANLGPLQQQVLDHVWEYPACSVRQCRDALAVAGHELAYTTVQTVFDTLHRKRLVSRRRNGNAFLYTARESRGGLLRRMLDDLLRRFGEGPAPVASCLVDALEEGRGEQLEALIAELKQRGHV
jgi:predicted transcriptional regulator